MIKSLSDETLDQLLEDHWREIKGILKEQKRRRIVSNTNKEPLDSGHRDGRSS
jgi:hypothetical protein